MRKGFTILEVLVSLAMIGLLVVSIFPVIGWLNSRSRAFRFDSEAATVLQEGTEAAYNYFQALNTWPSFTDENYYLAEDLTGGELKWTVLAGGERNVGGRFRQWMTISDVCRDAVTGDILWIRAEPSRTIDCSDLSRRDARSRMVRTFVAWNENGVNRQINSELLLVKL